MKCRCVLVVLTMLLLTGIEMFAQQRTSEASADVASLQQSPTDVAFWVDYWGKPRVALFGSEEEAFNQSMQAIVFPWNIYDAPSNPNILDANVQWLKDHPSDRFYITGYASAEGGLGYNLNLSGRRADWVKQTLISKGIPESQIVMAVGWGQLYPVCAGFNEDCLSQNRLVRFVYSPR
jgi:outer membrane protein OmpA-like peptidoglycan-associated protein